MKDFHGRELAVGDKVLYATCSYSKKPGMREGLVTKIDGERISVRPVKGPAGTPINRKKYVDLRSGKFVDPWNHRKVMSHMRHKETGKKLEGAYYTQTLYSGSWGNSSTYQNPDYVAPELREYVETQYEDYIKKIELIGGWVSHFEGGNRVVKL